MKPRCDLVGVEKKPRPSGRRAGLTMPVLLWITRGRLARPFRTENNSARGLVPERKAPPKRGAKCTGHQLAEGGVFWPSEAGQFGNSERGDPVPLAASGCCQSVAVEQQVSVPNGDSSANWIVGTRRLRPAPRPARRPPPP